MEVEERAKGTVEKSVFVYYINQVGKNLVMAVALLYIGGSFIRVFRDWWLSRKFTQIPWLTPSTNAIYRCL